MQLVDALVSVCVANCSDEGREGEDEEFTPSGTKVKKPKRAGKAVQTPQAKARASRRKRSPWSQTRSLRSGEDGRSTKRSVATAETDESAAAPAGNDNDQEEDGASLFGTLIQEYVGA